MRKEYIKEKEQLKELVEELLNMCACFQAKEAARLLVDMIWDEVCEVYVGGKTFWVKKCDKKNKKVKSYVFVHNKEKLELRQEKRNGKILTSFLVGDDKAQIERKLMKNFQ